MSCPTCGGHATTWRSRWRVDINGTTDWTHMEVSTCIGCKQLILVATEDTRVFIPGEPEGLDLD